MKPIEILREEWPRLAVEPDRPSFLQPLLLIPEGGLVNLQLQVRPRQDLLLHRLRLEIS